MQTNDDPVFHYVDEDNIDEELLCSLICMSPLVDPVVHNACKNSFCRSCISAAKWSCPTCRTGTQNVFSDVNTRMFLNMLDRLKVECSQCKKEMQRSNFKSHIPNCETPCPRGCGVTTTRADQTKHEGICALVVVQCPARSLGCNAELKRGEMEEHIQTCKWEQSRWIIEPLHQKIGVQNQKIDQLAKSLEELRLLVTKGAQPVQPAPRNPSATAPQSFRLPPNPMNPAPFESLLDFPLPAPQINSSSDIFDEIIFLSGGESSPSGGHRRGRGRRFGNDGNRSERHRFGRRENSAPGLIRPHSQMSSDPRQTM